MGAWVIFRRARITLFCFLALVCLTWATLFAVFLFHELSHFSRLQKIIVASMLSLYGFTAALLYLMVVTQFHLWWDVARLLALLVVHTGGSVLFTIYSPRFPCHNFGTEMVCRKFIHAIFIGCWALSGIMLCFIIALWVTTFIPRSAESLQETEEVNAPSTPASFGAGGPSDEQRFSAFYSVDSRTGFVTYYNSGNSPESTPSPVNSSQGETITTGPPRLYLDFESPNTRRSENSPGGTMPMTNAPTEHFSVVSGPRRADSFRHNPLGNPSPPPIYSGASMIRPGVGRKNPFVAENRLYQSSAFPGLKRDALSPTSLHRSPPTVTTPRDLATEYTPTLYSVFNQYSVPVSLGGDSQRERTYPDRTRKVALAPSVSTSHSSAASVHPMWMEPTPQKPPPPVLTPDVARFRGSGPYLGPKGPSSGNNAPFATSESNAPLNPKLSGSEPHRTIQHYGALHSYHPPIKERSFSQKGGDHGQVLDQTQWRQLVLNAAAKP